MQAAMYEARAILLRGYRFSENSLVSIWLTDRHGKVKTAARNAIKPGSPFSGRLELFTEAEIVFKSPSKSKNGDLYALGEVTVSSDTALPATYLTLLTASYFAELCDLCTEPMHPVPELFALLQRAWGFLRREHSSRRAVEHFETQLARSLGIYDPAFPAHHSLAATVRRLPANRTRLLKHLESMAATKP
jgi:DNA repair protein RecO (recombination protein O)